MADEVTIETLQAELTAAKQRISDLNNESKGHRLNWQNAKTEAERLVAETGTLREQHAAGLTAAEKKAAEAAALAEQAAKDAETKVAEAHTAAEQRVIRAELRTAAIKAGMVDLDGIKLLDLSAVKLNADGDVEGADALIEAAKAAKPWLFGKPSTSNPQPPPPPKAPNAKAALEMTDAEFEAALKAKSYRNK